MGAENKPGADSSVELKYPRSVFFIVGNEFCERFSYYGMKTILALYLSSILRYDDDSSTIIYHLFTMLAYFFPLFGAIIADSWLGKYRTILYLSLLYAIGNLVLSTASISILNIPQRSLSILGLLLIAIGTGGIKPCVCPFGGDQFVLPQQEKQLLRYFSIFYFSINAGSLFSTSLTPILREDVKCFDENSCFPLAFGVPAVLMVISLIIFLIGSPLYIKNQPEGNIIVTVVNCISRALKNKFGTRGKYTNKNHWLEYADDKYDYKQISEIQAALNVLYMFLPVPLFWALFDQQGSRWIFQATNMDGRFFGYNIKPDQMQVLNPLMILAFIPLFETCFYPVVYKIAIRRPLQKMAFGGILAALAFVFSAFLEFQIEKTLPVMPNLGEGQIRIFNSLNCDVNLEKPFLYNNSNIEKLSAQQFLHFPVNGSIDYPLNITANEFCSTKYEFWSGSLKIDEGKSISYIISYSADNRIIIHQTDYDDIHKDPNGFPKLRIFYGSQVAKHGQFKLLQRDGHEVKQIDVTAEQIGNVFSVPIGRYDVYLNSSLVKENVMLDPGSISQIIVRHDYDQNIFVSIIQMVPINSIHMLWQLPQIITITAAEILFSVTGLQFSFTQAPESMKSVLSAAWLLTVSFGNLIVVIISEVKYFNSQAYEFLLFAGLMLLDIGVFILMALKYKYIENRPKLTTGNDYNTFEPKSELTNL